MALVLELGSRGVKGQQDTPREGRKIGLPGKWGFTVTVHEHFAVDSIHSFFGSMYVESSRFSAIDLCLARLLYIAYSSRGIL